MSGDYSISLNGILAAERNLLQSARRMAAPNMPDPADIVAVDKAKLAVEANIQVISMQQKLDREVLDLFA
jgi:hypothetical protein